MDSTRAIIRLWRLCVPSGLGPQVGGDGAIPVEVLKEVLERELESHVLALGGRSVDEILWSYMQPDSAGVVGFLQFWRGMEEILQARGALRSHLSSAQEHAIDGFRFLRTCVLEMVSKEKSQGRSVFSVSEIRYFIECATSRSGPEGETFWQQQAAQLPEDNVCVTGEEVASALLAWLEQLVDDEEAMPWAAPQQRSSRPVRTHQISESHVDDTDDSEASAEEDSIVRTPRVAPATAHSLQMRSREARVPVLSMAKASSFEFHGQPHTESGPGPTIPPPATPKGPPPRRSVNVSSASGSCPRVAEVAADVNSLIGRTSSLEAGLTWLLEHPDRRPAMPTKEMAAEWRDTVEFQVALARRLSFARQAKEELTFASLCIFAKDHFSSSRARRRRGISPRTTNRKAALCMKVALQGLLWRRVSEGFGVLRLACRIAAPRKFTDPQPETGGCRSGLMRELLKSQCETAVVLEHRVKLAGRAGALAFCLDRLQRLALRSPWMLWRRLAACPLDRLPATTAISPGTPATTA
ncbi:unnamed protein product [Polarella glacialis]|uniref:Uncharacterized protein n=1 Tax=Polarella glacialis TaxID=89957 RepID=A0A813LRL6_POLGL|nr:unnamed protein product [Polarella glacialis]